MAASTHPAARRIRQAIPILPARHLPARRRHGRLRVLGTMCLLALSLALGACRSDLERARDPATPAPELAELAVAEDPEVRLAVATNPSVAEEHLRSLISEGDSRVRLAVLERPEIPEDSWALLRADPDPEVRLATARHPRLPPSQVLEIASSGDPPMKLALLEREGSLPEPPTTAARPRPGALRLGGPEPGRAVPRPSKLRDGAGERAEWAEDPALRSALLRTLAQDESPQVRKRVAASPFADREILEDLAADPSEEVRARVAAHPDTHPVTLYRMLDGGELAVRRAVAGNPSIGPKTARQLAGDPNREVRAKLAANQGTPAAVLNALARRDRSDEVRQEARRQGSRLPEIRTDLVRAQRAGLVTVEGRGSGLQRLKLELELEVVQPVRLTVEAGTVFRPGAAGTQAMVVRRRTEVRLTAERPEVQLSLEAACAEMDDDVPGSGDRFTLEAPPRGDLAKLLAVDGFTDKGFRVQQFAIWTITDDPGRHGYVGLGTFGFGSGPSDGEMDEIRDLFRHAGITTAKYRALK